MSTKTRVSPRRYRYFHSAVVDVSIEAETDAQAAEKALAYFDSLAAAQGFDVATDGDEQARVYLDDFDAEHPPELADVDDWPDGTNSPPLSDGGQTAAD